MNGTFRIMMWAIVNHSAKMDWVLTYNMMTHKQWSLYSHMIRPNRIVNKNWLMIVIIQIALKMCPNFPLPFIPIDHYNFKSHFLSLHFLYNSYW